MMKTWQAGNGVAVRKLVGGRNNVFLIADGNRTCLVDGGRSYRRKALLERLRRAGVETVDYLILTHTHYDHAESAAFLKAHFGLKIIVHRSEAALLEQGANPVIEGTIPATRLLVFLFRRWMDRLLRYPPAKPDILVDGPFDLAPLGIGASILPTPGHTEGSVSVIVGGEIALAGDAIFGWVPGSVFSPFGQDIPRMVESWRILADTGCRTFLPAHGWERSRDLLTGQYRKYTGRR